MAESELDALLDEHGEFDAVATALAERVESAEDDEAKATAWRLLAELEADYREDLPAASEALEHMLDLVDDDEALARLASYYERSEDWEALAAVLVDLSAIHEDPAGRSEVLRKAASVYLERLEQPEGAQLVLRKALAEAPLDRTNWQAVEETWTSIGDHAGLAEVLGEHASLVAESATELESVPLLVATARGHEAAGNTVLAEAFITRAALLDEDDEEILRTQIRLQEQAEHFDALAESMERLADKIDDPDEEADLRRRVGRLRFEHLEDASGAIAAFARAHTLHGDADDADTLGALYEATGRFDDVVRLLRETADGEDDPADKIPHLVRIARLHIERLDAPEAARRWLDEALEIDASNAEALGLLGDLYESAEDWAGLADHLRRHAGVASDEERPALLVRRAALQENELEDPSAAIATLQELQALDDTAEGCLENLLRLLEQAGRTADAVAIHERMAELAQGDDDWREHMMAVASGHRTLAEADEAAASYRAVLARAPKDTAALAALEEIQIEVGDTEGAIASLRAQIDATAEPAERKALLLRLGNLEKVDDPVAAAESFRAVLELDRDHATALAALVDCYEGLEAWESAADVLIQRVELEREFVSKAALLARLGALRGEHLGDAEGARTALEEAIELDPSCVSAARALAESYMAEQAWERARPLLETQVAALDDDVSAEDRCALHLDLAQVCDLLGMSAAAVAEYEAVTEIDPANVPAMSALARLYEESARMEDADRLCRMLMAEFLDDVPEAERLDLITRTGRVAAVMGDEGRARELFQRALDVDPEHEPALRALARMVSHDADADEKVRTKRSLLALATDPTERVRLLLDIGAALVEANDIDGAVDAYSAAREIEPKSKATLHSLLSIYTRAERWDGAAETLSQLVDTEEDAARRAKFLFAEAAIYRDQLGDAVKAVEAFGRILNDDPRRTDVLEAIQKTLTDAGEFARLEGEYREQLRRLSELKDVEDERYAVVVAMAALYRDRMDRPDDAIAALEIAAELHPGDLDLLVAISEIYPKGGKSDDDLIRQHRAIVELAPDRESSHHVLFGALRRQRRFDEAWNEASILTVLGSREPEPSAFYAELRPATVVEPSRAFGRADWRLIQHPDLSEEATRLLAAVAATLRRVYSVEHKSLGLHHKKDLLDPLRSPVIDNLARYCAPIIDVALPELYKWQGRGIQNGNTEPRSLLIGTDAYTAPNDRRMTFRVARAVCLMRNEFYLASAVSPPTLVALVQATIAAFTGGIPQAWDNPGVRAWVTAIRNEPDELLTTLGGAVSQYLATGQNLNLTAWPRAVEFTANRVALMICGDLQRAAQASQDVTLPLGDVDVHERVLDMVRFSASEEYAVLRTNMGLAVGQG